MTEITPLTSVSHEQIEALLDRAFGRDRKTRTAYRLRDGATAVARLSFAAWREGALVGTVQSWPVMLEDAPLTMVGPVAVEPGTQNDGVGAALMAALLAAAGDAPLMMIGDPDYYGRFGFSATPTRDWSINRPVERHRLLARGHPLPRLGKLTPARCVTAA